jgi:hypothetical protein
MFYASCSVAAARGPARGASTAVHAQVWSIAAILTFGMCFMGYTRAISTGNVAEAFAWSISWAMPLGAGALRPRAPDAEFRRLDLWLGVWRC